MNSSIIVTLLLCLFVVLLLSPVIVEASFLEPREGIECEKEHDSEKEAHYKRTPVYEIPTTFVHIHVHYPLSKLCSDCNLHVVSSVNSWDGFDYTETVEDFDPTTVEENHPKFTDQSKAIKVSDNELAISIPFTNKQVGVTHLLSIYYLAPNNPTETTGRWLQTNCPSALSGEALVNGGKQLIFKIPSMDNVTYDVYPFFCKSKGRLYEFEVLHELHNTMIPNESMYKGKVQVYLPASYEENPTPRPTHVLLKTDSTPFHNQDEMSLDFMQLQGVIPELIVVWVKSLSYVGNNSATQLDGVTTKGTSSARSKGRNETNEGGARKLGESEVTWYRHCSYAQNSALSDKRKNNNISNTNNNNGGTINNNNNNNNNNKERAYSSYSYSSSSSSKYSTTTSTTKTSSVPLSSNDDKSPTTPFAFCLISKAKNESCPLSLIPAYAFLDFFLKGVLTKMENTLGIPIPTREKLSVYGSLEGGVIACSLVYSNSSIFSKGYCSSPSFSSEGGEVFLDLVKKQIVSNPVTIMIDSGGRESSDRKSSLDAAYQALMARTDSFVLGKNLMLTKYSSSSDTSFRSNLSKRLPIALSFLYGDRITLAYSDRGTVLRYSDIYRPFSFGVTFEIPSMMAYQLEGATESKALQ